jgi:SAM-dependent methyltransferase
VGHVEGTGARGYPDLVASPAPYERFSGLDYEAFRQMAGDSTLSSHERSGFPDSLREGAEAAILADIELKLPVLRQGRGGTVVDIGCGANPLTAAIIERCRERQHELTLVDSLEVLAHHREGDGVRLRPGRFPGTPPLLADAAGRCDAVIAYSVLQLEFADSSIHAFVDAALTLLAPGGRLLVADLPNASMRRRFLASEAGRAYHREYTGRHDDPAVVWPRLPLGEIDDGVLYGLLARIRDAGFHAWLMPQATGLPMANRREDLLCARP